MVQVIARNQKFKMIIPPEPATTDKLKLFPNWTDQRCFIIGGGPSLEGFDFSCIKNENTIGINKAFVKYSCTINYGMDATFYHYLNNPPKTTTQQCDQNSWNSYLGLKVFLRTSTKYENVISIPKIGNFQLSKNILSGIWGGNNSGMGAIMLAISLGANRIYLLGYDLKVNGDKNHWHSGYPTQTSKSMARNLPIFLSQFKLYEERLNNSGVKIVNLTPNSALECFRQGSLEEVLSGAIA